jgi:hypothetical protein
MENELVVLGKPFNPNIVKDKLKNGFSKNWKTTTRIAMTIFAFGFSFPFSSNVISPWEMNFIDIYLCAV